MKPQPTLTTQGTCNNVTNCTGAGLEIGTPATYTSDNVCAIAGSDVVKLSTTAIVIVSGVVGAVVVVLVLLGFALVRRMNFKHSSAMKQARSESTALNERMERLLGAWEILWEHIQLKSRLAEGTCVVPSAAYDVYPSSLRLPHVIP